MNLEGKVAVVTGGGRGIGAETARRLAAAGAAVVVCSRTEREIEGVATELRDGGHEAHAIAADVTDPAAVDALAERTRKEAGPVEILVNNAGGATSAPLHRLELDEWNATFAKNATSTFLVTRAFLPDMTGKGWGRVVNVASIAGVTGARYIAAYAAAKHAVVGFTRCIAAEVAAKGVTVNAICPGYVETSMTEESLDRIASRTGLSRDDALATILSDMPQKRLIEAGEVAHQVLSLCHHDARGVNGQTIVLDGGGLLA